MGCFPLVPRFKVNLSKSMVVGVGCEEEVAHSFDNSNFCKSIQLPIKYLGLPKIESSVGTDGVEETASTLERKN